MRQFSHRISVLILAATPLAFVGGCDREKAIHSYAAPKETPVAPASLTYPGDLRWTLPAQWVQAPVPKKAGFRPVAAIAVLPDDPELLLTISQLPDSEGARSIAANVGRWAGQLKIDPPTGDELAKVVTHRQVAGVPVEVIDLKNDTASQRLLGAIVAHGNDTWVFKLSGPTDVIDGQKSRFDEFVNSVHFDGSDAPAAVAQAAPAPTAPGPQVQGPPAPGTPAPAESSTSDSPLAHGVAEAQWTLPAGWTAEPGNSFRLATVRPNDNGSTEIKVSKIASLGGGPGANVSRWRGEVGLDPVDDEHADAGEKASIGGRAWTIHDYTGPAKGGSREVIAVTESGGETWFLKLAGPTDAVAKVKPAFDQFLASIKLGS